MLSESKELLTITFSYGQPTGFGISFYEFSPRSLGIRRAYDFLKDHQSGCLGIPYSEKCYLYVITGFHGSVPKLCGLVNRLHGHYPKEDEVHVFINKAHNQAKVYSIVNGQDCIYQVKTGKGTFCLPRGFDRQPYIKICWQQLLVILQPPFRERKQKEKKSKKTGK